MSSNSFPVSSTFWSSSTYTTERLVREIDWIFSTRAFWAMASSIRRVMSCSIFSALDPGQGHKATATRTEISGSLRLGI